MVSLHLVLTSTLVQGLLCNRMIFLYVSHLKQSEILKEDES